MSLKDKLKSPKTKPKREGPVWKGPCEDGITQSLLSRFLCCRERFRLLVVEGLKPADMFNHHIEYGNMWHVCEEEWAKQNGESMGMVRIALEKYGKCLCQKYPYQQEQVQHWYNICKVQFPLYVDYWAGQKEEQNRTPLFQEQSFKVPYDLPSGRVVLLRGKWDGGNLLGPKRSAGIYLQENKTKGSLDEGQILRQLQFDLQTMLYLVALRIHLGQHAYDGQFPKAPLKGVVYNCVRRPLSGGKGSIRQHKATSKKPAETAEHFYGRVKAIIEEDPGHFFMRWKVEVTTRDLERFKQEFLTPILEQLCDWWEWIRWSEMDSKDDPFAYRRITQQGPTSFSQGSNLHWRTPFGFYNVLAEGGSSELDEYLATGSEAGLERTETLFPELE